MPPHESAARETYEEAGVGGQIAQKPLGSYKYDKKLKDGKVRPCRVDVFSLEVTVQHKTWPEKSERSTSWMRKDEAAASVGEIQLVA